jgi:hypothetical protein
MFRPLKGLWDGSHARRHHLEDRFIVEIASDERFTEIPPVHARPLLLVSIGRLLPIAQALIGS